MVGTRRGAARLDSVAEEDVEADGGDSTDEEEEGTGRAGSSSLSDEYEEEGAARRARRGSTTRRSGGGWGSGQRREAGRRRGGASPGEGLDQGGESFGGADGVGTRSGTIERLEVCNFKSYAGAHVIGPFHGFTAVVGPNGSGKSNLMDAISFVLGVRSAHLRGSSLRELVYSGEAAREGQEATSVVLVVKEAGEGGKEVRLGRSIAAGGASSEYRVDGRVTSWEDYDRVLRSFGLLVRARNFLIFQGDVESVAAKSPRQLTDFFEEISGSAELKARYEELEGEKMRAEEEATRLFQRRKGVTHERRERKAQSEEARAYAELADQLAQLRAQRVLFSILCLDADAATKREELEVSEADLSRAVEEQAEADSASREQRQAHAKAQKEVLLGERKLGRLEAQSGEARAAANTARERRARVERQQADARKKLAKAKETAEAQVRDVALLEKDLAEVEAAERVAEANLHASGEGASERVHLEGEQLARYHATKQEARHRTHGERAALRALEAEQEMWATKLKAADSRQQSLRDEIKRLSGEKTRLTDRRAESKKEAKSLAEELARHTSAKASRGRRVKEAEREAARLAGEIDEIESRLRGAKAERIQSETEARERDAVDALMRHFPGVLGKLVDLCHPVKPAFNVCVTAAMGGKDLHSLVTDTQGTALQCVKYLQDQRMGHFNFLPLDSIRAPRVDTRLRETPGARMAIDFVKYEPRVEPAIRFSIGNTLVCDTMDDARRIAFGREDARHRVVTMEGDLIHQSGLMSFGAGTSVPAAYSKGRGAGASTSGASTAFDKKDYAALKLSRNTCLEKREELLTELRRLGLEEQQAEARSIEVDTKLKHAQAAVKVGEQRLGVISEEIESLRSTLAAAEQEREEIGRGQERDAGKVAELRGKITEVEAEVFADFATDVGVADIKEYEAGQLQAVKGEQDKMARLQAQLSRLRNQLAYERARDTAAPIIKLQNELTKRASELKKAQEEADSASEREDALSREIALLKESIKALKDELASGSESLADVKETSRQHVRKVGGLKKTTAGLRTALEELRASRLVLIEEAAVENTPLPRIAQEETNGDVLMEDAAGEGQGKDQGQGDHLDFSTLPRKLSLPPRDSKEKAELEAWIDGEIRALEEQAARVAPNQKAAEQYERMRSVEKGLGEEYDEAKRVAKSKADLFARCAAERRRRLMDVFEAVQKTLGGVYKELTRDQDHPYGGNAYISLEDPEHPFLHGMKFTAMPPAKRFREMDQLSGGEKSIAALALLFAVHRARPSPFFILDEVDAALDGVNVAKLTAYLREHAREQENRENFQAIVISLKEKLFENADALVGVAYDFDTSSSAVYTFDLGEHEQHGGDAAFEDVRDSAPPMMAVH